MQPPVQAVVLASFALLLSACGGSSTVKPAAFFMPKAGDAVGSGSAVGTVRVSPSAYEVQTMTYINEARTQGTVAGKAVNPSCMTRDTLLGLHLAALSYDGTAALAARNHTTYLTTTGSVSGQPHAEIKGTTGYTGDLPEQRVDLVSAQYQLGLAQDIDEILITGDHEYGPAQDVTDWLNSRIHCQSLLDYTLNYVGAARSQGAVAQPTPATQVNGTVYPYAYAVVFTKR